MKKIKNKRLDAIILSLLILTGSLSLTNFSNASAQNPNLYVSADNPAFQNRMSGPQVIEVVVRDSNISNTGKGLGEPDVTVNGKDLRMVQAVDGNWYGYFADRKQAEIADSTVGLVGKGLDFGTLCTKNTSVLGISVSDSEGVAIPISGTDVGGQNGTNPPNQISQECSLPSSYDKNSNNVVRQPKAINQGNSNIKLGQIGLASSDLWPFVQLYDFSSGGNVVVQYNRGGGPQKTTLTFDTADKLVQFGLDRTSYPRSADVNLIITDLSLNIDPTDEDSWSFGTTASNPSAYYLLYEESGKSDSDGTQGAVNLVPYLGSMMFKDNGVLKINPKVQGQTNVVTIKDNNNSETNGDGELDISLVSSGEGSIGPGNQPITLTETSPNSGVFTTADFDNDSVLVTTRTAQRGTSASIEYNKKSVTMLVSFGKASISLDEQLKGTEWNSGEEMPVILTDSDLNKNNLAKEDLDLFNPDYLSIPSLSTGDPFTLGESGTEGDTKITASFLNAYSLAPIASGQFALSDTILGTGTKVSVDRFSEIARIDPVKNSSSNALVIDLKTNLKELRSSIYNPFDPSTNFRGVNMFNFDIRSLSSNIGNVDIYLLVGKSSILDSNGNPSPDVTAIKITSDKISQNLINLSSGNQIQNPQALHSNLFSNSFSGNEPIGIMFAYPQIQNIGTATKPIVADFFSYGLIGDGFAKNQRIANQIVRIEMEEIAKDAGKFRGSLEYVMLNQLNIFDPKTYEKIIPIDDEPVFLMIDEMKANDAPRVNYYDLGSDGARTAVSDQQDILAHMGVVVLSVTTYKPGDVVGVKLSDKDLNVNSDLVDIYTVVDPTQYPDDPAADTIGLPNLGLTSSNQPFGRLLEITFDDERWLKSSVVVNGKSCPAISGSNGLASTGFTLIETGKKTGEFTGTFKIPAQYCSRNDGVVKSTTGVDIGARYYDFRGQSSQAAITSASAAVSATSGIVKLDKSVYPVPVGSVSAFYSSGKSSSTNPDGNSIFPFHLTAVTKNGDPKAIDAGEELGPRDTVLYVQVNDGDYNLAPNGEDKIAQNVGTTTNGPVKVVVTRGTSSIVLATAGGEVAKSGVITVGKNVKSGITRELGPITETSPNSGIFQFSLPIRYTDGPSSTKCPETIDTGFTKLDQSKTGVLSRFDIQPTSGNFCILQGDVITVEYSDQADASGSPRTVTDSAAFDLRIGSLQSDLQSYIIGHDAIITLIDPDLNFDSKKAETYSLDLLEWDGDNVKATMGNLGGGVTLNGKIFDPRPGGLRETGDSTGIFQTTIKVPSEINGKPLDRGESIKITYNDWGTPGSDFVGKNNQKFELRIFTSNIQSLITLDKNVYSWTDKVYITIAAPDYNFDDNKIDEIGNNPSNEIKISTRGHQLTQYKLTETGVNSGIFAGEVILTGFPHDADGNPSTGNVDGFDTMPRTQPKTGGGPTNGYLESKNDDGLTVSFQYSDRQTITASSFIKWNIGEVQWVQGAISANGNAIVRVIDPDMNLNPETVDNFSIDVWSDSDLGGIDMTVTETGPATGIFVGNVVLSSTDQSSGNRLRVNDGDYITAKYEDNTLPKPYTTADELKITASALVGPIIAPLERVPVTNNRIVDSFGDVISQVNVNQQVQVTSDISNNNITNQPFTYLVQIKDSSGKVQSLSWIVGNLVKDQSFSPSVSWIPENPSLYTATIFVWQSLDDPIALSPTVEFTVNVS